MIEEFIVDRQCGESFKVNLGDKITIIDMDGKQVVDFFAVSLSNHAEFLSTGVTIDCNENLHITKGGVLFSNLYRPMFKIIDDDVGRHDLIHPCCRSEMYEHFYKNGDGHRNCLDNINMSLQKHGIPQMKIIHPFNIFMNTIIHLDGTISVEEPLSKAEDKIILQAEMDAIIGIAACSVSESKCNGGTCTPIKVIIERAI